MGKDIKNVISITEIEGAYSDYDVGRQDTESKAQRARHHTGAEHDPNKESEEVRQVCIQLDAYMRQGNSVK